MLDATFRRGGDIRRDPGWIITVEGHEVVARWTVTQPPLVMTRAGAGQDADLDMHSALFFTDEAAITFDGQAGGRTALPLAALGAAAGHGS